MVLAHEVAHWRHRDNAWMLLMRLTCAALWWQPLSWLLSRQMSLASEEACDIAALTMGCPARSYADCLLALAERLLPTRLERSLGNGVVPFRSALGQRIQTILRSPRQNPLPAWFRPATIVAVAVGMVLGFRMISGATSPTTANDVVRQYIADCANGRLAQAYQLLSPATQNYITYTDFVGLQWTLYAPGQHYSPLFAIDSLFTEPHNTANIRFEVIGDDPQQPNRVLVRASQPRAKERSGITISVATLTDPKTGSVQLDLVQTALPLMPNVVQRLAARKVQRECLSHLHEIGYAMFEYIQDHDEHFPHAEHWMDEIMPYLKDTSILHDPAAPAEQKYSYAFNRNLSGVPIARIASPAEVVMVFDSSKGVKNASDAGQSLPHLGRHTAGNDYAFADAHVKWFSDLHRPPFIFIKDRRF